MSVENLPIDKLTRVYVKMRDAKAELNAEFKKKEDALNEQMEAVKSALLEYCKQQNVESVRTEAGLVYRTVKTRYWTSDWEAMHKFIVDNDLPQLLEKRLNQTAVKSLLEENPEMVPPGVNTNSEYTITVRKK